MRKSGRKKTKDSDVIDEVEELLKLTQEDLLLKLTVNSNTKSIPESSSSSQRNKNTIDPDLDRRFQALRSTPTKQPVAVVDDDELFARFAALKGTDSTTSNTTAVVKNDDDDDDEVSKIINWAIDAARLDPSPSSDIDDNDDEDEEDEDEDSSDNDECRRKVDDRKKKVSKK